MENPAVERFHRYVEQTSRQCAWEKRKKLATYLCDQNFPSMNQIFKRIRGMNRRDLAWLSQAMRDGQIRIGSDGMLRLAAPETSQPANYFEMADRALTGLNRQLHAEGREDIALQLTQLAINLEGILDGTIEIRFRYLDDESDPIQGRP